MWSLNSSKAAMSVVVATIIIVQTFAKPTSLSPPSSTSAAAIPEWIIESCPQHAALLRTGGIMDFAPLPYETNNGGKAEERLVGCTTPDVRDPCGAHRCWLANNTVRGQIYSETRCDRRQGGRPTMGKDRSGKFSDLPFRQMQCVENPKQIGYVYVGKCLGANVFRQEEIANKCRLQMPA